MLTRHCLIDLEVLAASSRLPVKSVQVLAALAKSKFDPLFFARSGIVAIPRFGTAPAVT